MTLTALTAASSGLTIYAGEGTQPEFRVYVDPSLTVPQSGVNLELAGSYNTYRAVLRQAQSDALGTFYAKQIDTRSLQPGNYRVTSWLGPNPSELSSEALTLVVDRTPPTVTLTIDGLPAGNQPVERGFQVTAAIGCSATQGLDIADIQLEALGPAGSPAGKGTPAQAWQSFATQLEEGSLPASLVTAEALLDGSAIADDTAGIGSDPDGVLVRATVTDLLGNVATSEVRIPVQVP